MERNDIPAGVTYSSLANSVLPASDEVGVGHDKSTASSTDKLDEAMDVKPKAVDKTIAATSPDRERQEPRNEVRIHISACSNIWKALSSSPCSQGETHPADKRVLLIDDVLVQRLTISRQLANFEVTDFTEVHNAEEGLGVSPP